METDLDVHVKVIGMLFLLQADEQGRAVEVRAGDSIVAQGSGNSKKVAEQEAARIALIELAKKAEANGRALP